MSTPSQSARHLHPAAMVAGDVFDDGQAEAGATGGAGPGLVGPVEPLEDPVDVGGGDPDPLVGDGDRHVVGVRPGGDPHDGVLAGVGDRVLHEVGHGGGELAVAAVGGQAPLPLGHHLDPAGGGRRAGPVEHLGDHPVDRDGLRRGLRLRALEPGQLQQLLHQPAEPGGLVLDPLGEPAGGQHVLGELRGTVGRLGGVDQGLGEELQRPDRGLQLVADVGHEVPPHPGQPVRLGDVGGLDGDVPAADAHRPQVHAERVLPGVVAAPGQVELDLAPHPGPPHLPGEGTDQRVGRDGAGGGAGSEQAHRPRGRVHEHRHVVRAEHHDAGAQRVDGLAAESAEPTGLVVGNRRPPHVPAGALAPGRRRPA